MCVCVCETISYKNGGSDTFTESVHILTHGGNKKETREKREERGELTVKSIVGRQTRLRSWVDSDE